MLYRTRDGCVNRRAKGTPDRRPKGTPKGATVPVVHRGTRAPRSARCEADAAARGGLLWTHRCKPRGWGLGRGSGAVLESPALVAGLDDVAVVGESVEESGGHLGVTEHLEMPQQLDRRVAQVRVVDPHHPLYGSCFPVSDRRSGRGPCADRHPAAGRAGAGDPAFGHGLSSASEDLAAAASRQAHISVRTLLPLANHVRAVLASRNADLEGGGGRDLDRTPRRAGRIHRRAAAAPVAAASGRDATSAGAARGPARATSAAADRPVRGGPSC